LIFDYWHRSRQPTYCGSNGAKHSYQSPHTLRDLQVLAVVARFANQHTAALQLHAWSPTARPHTARQGRQSSFFINFRASILSCSPQFPAEVGFDKLMMAAVGT
jgi:hypothetical protein